jgi:hypothetical protein
MKDLYHLGHCLKEKGYVSDVKDTQETRLAGECPSIAYRRFLRCMWWCDMCPILHSDGLDHTRNVQRGALIIVDGYHVVHRKMSGELSLEDAPQINCTDQGRPYCASSKATVFTASPLTNITIAALLPLL